jgi:putative ABC transport system permease protein
MKKIIRRLDYILRHRRHEADLAEEMAFHRELLARRSEGGAGPKAFGNATLAREDARRVWIWGWADDLRQDLRYTVRSLRRQRAFALCAVAMLALGIGAVTSVFGLLDRLVVRSLPVSQPERLVYFASPSFSYPMFTDVQRRLPIFDGFFGWNMARAYVDWSGGNGPLVAAELVEATPEFFPTLGVTAAVGRMFGPGDTTVAVLSYAAWRRHFGGESAAIGRVIRVGTASYTLIGVTPAGFFGVAPGLEPELFLPVHGRNPESAFSSPTSSWLHFMGRLKPDVSRERANAMLQAVWPHVLELTVTPGMPPERRAMFLSRQTSLESGRTGFSRVRNLFGDPLRVLMALVVLLLGIACASVSNLLLARGASRRKEVAIRLAIGASRTRVFRQLVTEALLLTFTGAAIGLLLASWSSAGLVATLRTSASILTLDTTPGLRTISFVAALAFVVSIASAWLPAFGATRGAAREALHETGQPGATMFRRWSAGKMLVGVQVALAFVLLAGAVLFGRSLTRVLDQGAGLDGQRLLIVVPDAVAGGLPDAALGPFHTALLERLRATPGVEEAALAWKPPISYPGGSWTQTIAIDGGAATLSGTPSVYFNSVSPGYFSTVGMALRRGRDLAAGDTAGAPFVTVVNETLARRYFPNQDPIGHRISIGLTPALQNVEIVGVVQDAKYRMLQEPQRSIAYLAVDQHAPLRSGSNRNLVAVLRAPRGTLTVDAIRDTVRLLDPRVPVRVESVADRIRESTLNERVLAALAAGLGGIALILACAGLYGLIAYAVSRHQREIGLRMALGAQSRAVLWMVQREALVVVILGIVAGLAATFALGQFVGTLLFEVTPADPVSLVAASAVMVAVASLAAYIPARRAASLDPIAALKRDS